MHHTAPVTRRLLPFAVEASWATGRWKTLEKHLKITPVDIGGDFNVSIGHALLALRDGESATRFTEIVRELRESLASRLSLSTTASLQVCHDSMLRFHVLTELEMIAGTDGMNAPRQAVLQSLDRRLEVVGAYLDDKQYLLGIRRAAMQLSR